MLEITKNCETSLTFCSSFRTKYCHFEMNKKTKLFIIFQQPFHCEIEHKLGITCMTTGPVTCRVRLDRGGYVPGEAINIWATIDNQSKVTIKGTRASLTEVNTVPLIQGYPHIVTHRLCKVVELSMHFVNKFFRIHLKTYKTF